MDDAASMWTSFHAALVGGKRWEEFDRHYGQVIRGWAAGRGLQPADAEDVAQNVITRLLQAIHTYDPRCGAFRGWLYRVVRSQIADVARSCARRPGDQGSGDTAVREILEQEAAADELATCVSGLADDRLRAVDALRAQCEPRTWDMVVAFHGGESAAEVAARFGATVGAVHQAVYRVRQMAQTIGNQQ